MKRLKRTPRASSVPFGDRWLQLVARADDWGEEYRAGPAAFDSTDPADATDPARK